MLKQNSKLYRSILNVWWVLGVMWRYGERRWLWLCKLSAFRSSRQTDPLLTLIGLSRAKSPLAFTSKMWICCMSEMHSGREKKRSKIRNYREHVDDDKIVFLDGVTVENGLWNDCQKSGWVEIEILTNRLAENRESGLTQQLPCVRRGIGVWSIGGVVAASAKVSDRRE